MVRTWFLLDKDELAAFTLALRLSSLPAKMVSDLDVRLWLATDDPLIDTHVWLWACWLLNPEEADELEDIVNDRGERKINDTTPAGMGSIYRDDDELQPRGGWTPPLILADTTRKRFAHQAETTPEIR